MLFIDTNCNVHIFLAPIGVSYGQPASSDKICGPVELKPGFFLSNEPGYYKEGDFGVRLENILETVEAGKSVGSLIKIIPKLEKFSIKVYVLSENFGKFSEIQGCYISSI